MDVVWLSRLQFALTVGFHYIFPPITIGMGVVLVYLEAMFLKTRQPIYETAAKFWTRIFGLNFAIGVATGIVMEFQFGTNWSVYSRFVGDVFGSALAAEGVFAFFLESGFLAVLVFGWDRVSARMHFIATLLVALGSMFSAIWIVVANSWQQTPAGHHIVERVINGQPILRAEVVSFWQVVFNPSTLSRLGHVLIGAFIAGSFFILSISAYYLLKDRHIEFARRSFSGALVFATLASLSALVQGHFQSVNVYEHQPAKLAAFEGHFKTGPADLHLFGLPNPQTETVNLSVAIPGGLSLLLHGKPSAEVVGLDRFRPEDRPPVPIAFASYHLMVALGSFFIALTLFAVYCRWRKTLFSKRWLLWVFVFAVVGPLASNQFGWIAAETGRQPWIVYPKPVRDEAGQPILDAEQHVQYEANSGLRTAAAVSPTLHAGQVLGSIIAFGLIYLALLAVWLFVLDRKIRQGPDQITETGETQSGAGFAASARQLIDHEGSLTEAHEQRGGHHV